jgi:hypothetical protein
MTQRGIADSELLQRKFAALSLRFLNELLLL